MTSSAAPVMRPHACIASSGRTGCIVITWRRIRVSIVAVHGCMHRSLVVTKVDLVIISRVHGHDDVIAVAPDVNLVRVLRRWRGSVVVNVDFIIIAHNGDGCDTVSESRGRDMMQRTQIEAGEAAEVVVNADQGTKGACLRVDLGSHRCIHVV